MNKQIQFTSNVERSRAASVLCGQLFPALTGTNDTNSQRLQGELQRIITKSWETGLVNNDQIQAAGNWWLWAKNLIIENTFTKHEREKTFDILVQTTKTQQPIWLATSRSPELLHAQVNTQGDKNLPRSRQALQKMKTLQTESSRFLPTNLLILFADLMIDNLEEIKKHCDVDETISQNIAKLNQIMENLGVENVLIKQISQLHTPDGRLLKDMFDGNRNPNSGISINGRGLNSIAIAAKESLQSHQRMFGWTPTQSEEHNRQLGITMGLVGQAVKHTVPFAIWIHNEAFISRGALNNLFNDPKDPLPVICLSDLLESKQAKV